MSFSAGHLQTAVSLHERVGKMFHAITLNERHNK